MDNQDQIELISGCVHNNRKAQEQLYKQYYGAMIKLCLHYTKNDHDAVEVLNSGFLKVFQNIRRYDPGKANLYTWIRAIIVNSCIDFIRKKQSTVPCIELSDATEVHVPSGVFNKIKADALLAMVRQLPPATQAVFNLYVIEGYGHKEIGALLHISEGTSKWHLSEGRKALQRLIKLEEVNSHG